MKREELNVRPKGFRPTVTTAVWTKVSSNLRRQDESYILLRLSRPGVKILSALRLARELIRPVETHSGVSCPRLKLRSAGDRCRIKITNNLSIVKVFTRSSDVASARTLCFALYHSLDYSTR